MDYRAKMNGHILSNGVIPFDNLPKSNLSKVDKGDNILNDTDSLPRLKEDGDKMTLRTIQEVKNESDTSSDDDLESETSESDSSEDPVIQYTFPGHKDNMQENTELPSSNKEKTIEPNGEVPLRVVKNKPSTSILGASDDITTNDFVTTKSTTKDQMASDGLEDHDEPSTSGSSDVVLGTVSKKDKDLQNTVEITALEKDEVNNSRAVSDVDSDTNDQTDMLAELQKIVQDDEHLQQSGAEKSTDAHQSLLNASADKVDHGLGSSQNILEVSGTSDTVKLGGNNMPKDGIDSNNGAVIGSHGNRTYTQDIDHTNSAGGASGVVHVNGQNSHDDGQGQDNDEIPTMIKQTVELEQLQNSEVKSFSNLQSGKHISDETPSQEKFTSIGRQPNSESTVGDGPLKNVESKLLELEESNKGQTAEVKRLKSENEFLKTKFCKLEESSGHYHDVADKMLKRNEELEEHLLGMLKSQEIIYDLREKLNATTNDNKKLSKDYQDALKAIEAVDQMFGQKDALVKKWKESTEESRRLVELLKKHNAETAELEQVDQLKEKIADLREKLLKAEQIKEESNKKNEELQEQSKVWKKKFEYENEQGIKMNYELQQVKKAFKNQEKLAAKRGRKSQMLQLELIELKDTLKLAKESMVENEKRLKELERNSISTQKTYTSIIHEKNKQHSVLIKNSETYQKDIAANVQITEGLRKEIDSLKETEDELIKSEKHLEEALAKQEEMRTELETLRPELEKSKIAAIDADLYIEEQSVRLRELEEQCRELQSALQHFIYRDTRKPHKRRSASYNGRNFRPSHTYPTHPNLDMYRKLLTPPNSMHPRQKSPVQRDTLRQSAQPEEDKIEVSMDKVTSKTGEQFVSSKVHPATSTRPRSTYGNRSLSAVNNPSHEQTGGNTRDWIPKIVLVDSQKLDAGSENDSGSISADQYAMEYVKLGDKVLVEMSVKDRKQNLPGVVKYIGPVYNENFSKGIYAGLKLDIPVGDSNGNIDGRLYFHCLKKHGKFIKLSHILAVQNSRTQQYTRILPLAYK